MNYIRNILENVSKQRSQKRTTEKAVVMCQSALSTKCQWRFQRIFLCDYTFPIHVLRFGRKKKVLFVHQYDCDPVNYLLEEFTECFGTDMKVEIWGYSYIRNIYISLAPWNLLTLDICHEMLHLEPGFFYCVLGQCKMQISRMLYNGPFSVSHTTP